MALLSEIKRIQWRLYYHDGSAFSNLNGSPADAPCGGVICASYYDDDNRRRMAVSADYYTYENGRWFGTDMSGFLQYMLEPGWKAVKFGRMVGDVQYRAVMLAAMNDLPVDRAAVLDK